MRVNDILRARAHSRKDSANTAGEVEVGRDYADRGPHGAGITVPRQRCFDRASPFGTPATLSTHQRGNEHITLTLPGLG